MNNKITFSYFENILEADSFNFDIFQLTYDYGRENIMRLLGFYIFENLNYTNLLSMGKFEKFVNKTRKKYRNNPYHNVNLEFVYINKI